MRHLKSQGMKTIAHTRKHHHHDAMTTMRSQQNSIHCSLVRQLVFCVRRRHITRVMVRFFFFFVSSRSLYTHKRRINIDLSARSCALRPIINNDIQCFTFHGKIKVHIHSSKSGARERIIASHRNSSSVN